MTFIKKNKVLTIALILFSIFIYCFFSKIVDGNPLVKKDSLYYVNDLYASDARIYNNYLSNKEKKMYDFILSSVEKYDRKVQVPLTAFNCNSYEECASIAQTVYNALIVDHPEVINFSTYGWVYSNDLLDINFEYAVAFPFLSAIGEARIKIVVDQIRNATKDMTDIEKIKYVYEWMGDNNTYDTVFTYNAKNQSIYNVFMLHNAVCAGFAKASQIIFQNIGIESYAVTGISSGYHMWNIVKVNNKYYYFDSTIATSVKDKSNIYYYKGLDQLYMTDYKMDYENWYPAISKENMT